MRRLLLLAAVVACATAAHAKGPKVHSASIGKPHLVTWTTPQADGHGNATTLTLLIRPLIVDGRRKEWVTGDQHDVTDHSFVVLQVQHLNDAQPGEKVPHFIWQTGAWLLVERNTGHITVLHLAGYDSALSGITWVRDYAAYCALAPQAKAVYAEIVEIGQRKPIARKKVSAWPLPSVPAATGSEAPEPEPSAPQPPGRPEGLLNGLHHGPARRVPSVMQQMNTGAPHPVVCNAFEWMRDPLRVTITPRADLPPVTLDLSAIPPDATPPAAAPPAEQ